MDCIFYFLITLLQCSSILTINHRCPKLDSDTLKCDFIPKDIPSGFTSIELINFKENNATRVEVNSSYFMSKNWEHVLKLKLQLNGVDPDSNIILKDNSFHGLKSLKDLHINLQTQIELDEDVFVGLENLTLLDMSECVYLGLPDLVASLNGSKKLPNLETLKASKLNIYKGGIQFDTKFAEAIGDKSITTLDFSDTKVTKVNTTAGFHFLENLKNMNLSYCKISDIILDNKTDIRKLENISLMDMSHVPLSVIIPTLANRVMHHSSFPTRWNYYIYPEKVNMSFCVTDPGRIRIVNVTYKADIPFQWKSKQVLIRHNNIKYLDLKMECKIHKALTIEHIDATGNGMEFLHPSVSECFPNLVKFDLSDNQFNKMVNDHHLLFRQLLQPLSHLRFINLSFNQLKAIPENMFIKNHELEIIDCSHNSLEQVGFTLKYLPKLKVLKLQYNRIKILDSFSTNMLNSRVTEHRNAKATLLLENNPISCSQCEAKHFLYWLTHTKSMNVSMKDLTCITSKNLKRKVEALALNIVNDICKRKIITIFTTTSVGLLMLIALITILVLYKRRKHVAKTVNRRKLINKLKEGQGQNEFVSFLSYSSEDKDFVDDYVTNNLNENLQNMTDIDRNLVCTGDEYLRPGFMILDETTLCIERASSFIVVVSDNYNSSPYCHNELDMAYQLNKPIILFIKGIVDETLMSPRMKALFKGKVRLLWAFENNEYKLKASWEEICKSIVELIIQNRNI